MVWSVKLEDACIEEWHLLHLNSFRRLSYHCKVWEKKDPSTTSKPKKAKKEEKNQATPVPVSASEAPSSSVQSAVPIAPIIKTEISQNEPKIEPSNVPNIKIEQEPSPKIQARFGSIFFWTRIFGSKIFWPCFSDSNQNKEFSKGGLFFSIWS